MSIFKKTIENYALPGLLNKMQSIARAVTDTKFLPDFEINDRAVLERHSGSGVFVWYVYEFGTHLFNLNDEKALIAFIRDWLDGFKALEDKRNSDDRLYVLNIYTGDLRRVCDFKTQTNLYATLQQTAG